MTHFFISLPKNIIQCFNKKNLVWHALLIVTTVAIVMTGTDWNYFIKTRVIPESFFFPALFLGGILPIIVPVVLIVTGYIAKKMYMVVTGFAIAQAALLGSLLSSTYKAFTGRTHPPRGVFDGAIDTSHGFHFGFMEGGVFWGWPSSHTTIAFAMAITLIVLYPKSRTFVYLMLLYAFYIGISVTITGIHWFSEFIAGQILGSVIGVVVGVSFHPLLHKRVAS